MVAKKKKTRIATGIDDVLNDRLEEIEGRLDRLERGQLPAPEPPEEAGKEDGE